MKATKEMLDSYREEVKNGWDDLGMPDTPATPQQMAALIKCCGDVGWMVLARQLLAHLMCYGSTESLNSELEGLLAEGLLD